VGEIELVTDLKERPTNKSISRRNDRSVLLVVIGQSVVAGSQIVGIDR
jgi:hypothetical protein